MYISIKSIISTVQNTSSVYLNLERERERERERDAIKLNELIALSLHV